MIYPDEGPNGDKIIMHIGLYVGIRLVKRSRF